MRERAQQGNRRNDGVWQLKQIRSKQYDYCPERKHFDERVAYSPGVRYAVVGEPRDHAATHHHHQNQDDIESQLKARTRREFERSAQCDMYRQIETAISISRPTKK